MRCKNKNPHFKSAVQSFSGATQTLTATAAPVNFGVSVSTNTGVALEPYPNYLDVLYTGLYEFDFSVTVDATAAGDVTIQIYENGVALPETLRVVTVPIGYSVIDTETIRYVRAACEAPEQIQLYAKTDGTAVATVSPVTLTALKLA